MNAIDQDKVRALLMRERRRLLSQDDRLRWSYWASVVLSIAEVSRTLRAVVEVPHGIDDQRVDEVGKYLESRIVDAIANALGVDVRAAIMQEAERPTVFEGSALYAVGPGHVVVLPNGVDVRPLDPRPSFYLTDEEARVAFEAIGLRRLRAKCECDASVGFVCWRCNRDRRRVWNDPDHDPTQRAAEVAYRWASMMLTRRRVGGAT